MHYKKLASDFFFFLLCWCIYTTDFCLHEYINFDLINTVLTQQQRILEHHVAYKQLKENLWGNANDDVHWKNVQTYLWFSKQVVLYHKRMTKVCWLYEITVQKLWIVLQDRVWERPVCSMWEWSSTQEISEGVATNPSYETGEWTVWGLLNEGVAQRGISLLWEWQLSDVPRLKAKQFSTMSS